MIPNDSLEFYEVLYDSVGFRGSPDGTLGFYRILRIPDAPLDFYKVL